MANLFSKPMKVAVTLTAFVSTSTDGYLLLKKGDLEGFHPSVKKEQDPETGVVSIEGTLAENNAIAVSNQVGKSSDVSPDDIAFDLEGGTAEEPKSGAVSTKPKTSLGNCKKFLGISLLSMVAGGAVVKFIDRMSSSKERNTHDSQLAPTTVDPTTVPTAEPTPVPDSITSTTPLPETEAVQEHSYNTPTSVDMATVPTAEPTLLPDSITSTTPLPDSITSTTTIAETEAVPERSFEEIMKSWNMEATCANEDMTLREYYRSEYYESKAYWNEAHESGLTTYYDIREKRDEITLATDVFEKRYQTKRDEIYANYDDFQKRTQEFVEDALINKYKIGEKFADLILSQHFPQEDHSDAVFNTLHSSVLHTTLEKVANLAVRLSPENRRYRGFNKDYTSPFLYRLSKEYSDDPERSEEYGDPSDYVLPMMMEKVANMGRDLIIDEETQYTIIVKAILFVSKVLMDEEMSDILMRYSRQIGEFDFSLVSEEEWNAIYAYRYELFSIAAADNLAVLFGDRHLGENASWFYTVHVVDELPTMTKWKQLHVLNKLTCFMNKDMIEWSAVMIRDRDGWN